MNKYIHVRQIDEKGNFCSTGGLTIVYTHSNKDIFFAVARCSERDQFCKLVGRKIALERLLKEGPLDVVELKHPITNTIIAWISENYYDKPVIIINVNGRWIME